MVNVLLVCLSVSTVLTLSTSAKNVVCYFTSWTIYRPDKGKFAAANVDPKLCTHILYAFVGLGDDGHLIILDDWEANGLREIANLIKLKKQNTKLKVLVSMGGWNEGSSKYSSVAGNPAKRAVMVTDVANIIAKYGFDGFDLDWEYPCQRGGAKEDKKNFVTLLGELKSALNSKGLILSAAVSGGIATIDISYDVPGVSKLSIYMHVAMTMISVFFRNLDMINLMTYDYHGSFDNFVGHNAPLYASHLDKTEAQKHMNVASGVEYWIKKGADPRKINIGIGTYGRSFSLANASNTDLYAPISGGGQAGPYTRQIGVLGYNEICELHKDWEYIWDDEQKVPHRVSGNQWVGYDDERSIVLKITFAKTLNLGGAVVWSLDTDDFHGICGSDPYPLLRAINSGLEDLPVVFVI